MFVTILSYIAVWFIGAVCLACALAYLIHRGEKQKRAETAVLMNRIAAAGEEPKSGPILTD